jgi:antitoxin (DNA-binding transcriptional repressor) of toxin-antitoxin stability system
MPASALTMSPVKVVSPSGQSVEAAQVYSVTQLNQHTAQVLEEINNSGRAAVVTRHGKFVALITPLASLSVESVVLSQGPLADEFAAYERQDAGPRDLLSPTEVDRLIELQSEQDS